MDDDVHRSGDVHLDLERQPDVLGDLAASAVGAEHVLGLDRVFAASNAIADMDGDAVAVLIECEVLSVRADP